MLLGTPPGEVVASAGPLDIVPGETLGPFRVIDQALEEGEYACRATSKGNGKTLRGALRLKLLPDDTEALLPMQ